MTMEDEHAEGVTFADGTVAPVEDLYPDRPDLQVAALQAGVLPWTKAEFDEAVARRDATWGGSVISIYCDGRPGDQQGHARFAIDEAVSTGTACSPAAVRPGPQSIATGCSR